MRQRQTLGLQTKRLHDQDFQPSVVKTCKMKTIFLLLVFIGGLMLATAQRKEHITSLRVTLNVYSGNQNPEWTLQRTDNGFSAVLNKVFNLKTQSQLANTGGYQGFNVELFKGNVSNGVVEIGKCSDPQLEKFLINLVKDLIPDGKLVPITVANLVLDTIQTCPQQV